MASKLYDSVMSDMAKGAINIPSDTYKVMLVTAGYVENQATHTKRSDITNEITGTGYTAGGKAVVPTIALNTTTHVMTITFPRVEWPSATITARKAVYYKSRGGAANADELVGVDDFGSDVASTAGIFAVDPTLLPVTNNS